MTITPITIRRGFTLIEMIVSVALFSVVAVIAATAYLNLIDIDRRTRATSDLVNNMTFVMSSMSTNLRTGSDYQCLPIGSGDAYGNGDRCPSIEFTDSAGCDTTFSIANNGVNANDGIWESQTGGGSCVNNGLLTDPDLIIDSLYFTVQGRGFDAAGTYQQPQVIIGITGTMNVNARTTTQFTLQTTAVERGIELKPTP